MKKKELYLVTDNTSWWKRKKFRKNSAFDLLKHRKLGWKLINKTILSKKKNSIETKIFTKYILQKK